MDYCIRLTVVIAIFIMSLCLIIYLAKKGSKRKIFLFVLTPFVALFMYIFCTVDGSLRLALLLHGYPASAFSTEWKLMSKINNLDFYSSSLEAGLGEFECIKLGLFKFSVYFGV